MQAIDIFLKWIGGWYRDDDAAAIESAITANTFIPVCENFERTGSELRFQGIAVMLPEQGAGASAGSRGERGAFQEHDFPCSPGRELPGDAGAHNAAADDDNVGT